MLRHLERIIQVNWSEEKTGRANIHPIGPNVFVGFIAYIGVYSEKVLTVSE